jgi:LysM repeat protein
MDGAPACPFVAYVDDRDGRSTSPDHRHRCFAESPPAPRAVAHQEAYCLSSAFPVCPVFQEWARREAAQARGQGSTNDDDAAVGAAGAAAAAAATSGASGASPAWGETAGSGGQTAIPPPEPPVQRNPPRDWAAPPPWATAAPAARSSGSASGDAPPPRPIEGQGLAGSTADQLAGGQAPARSAAAWSASAAGATASGADDDLAGLVGPRPTPAEPPPPTPPAGAQPSSTGSGRRPTVSSTRSSGPTVNGPPWERARRDEVYPSIRRRASLPGLPRLAAIAGAIAISALILFMLPALFGFGGPSASPSPSASSRAAPSRSVAPTPVPAPTATVYVVKSGDTMSKIAKKFGVSLDDLIAANKDTIKNPDKLAVGNEVIIPLPPSEGGSAAPSGSAAP